MTELEILKQDLLSKERGKICNAAEKLSQMGIDSVSEILIPLLECEDVDLRNQASLALADLGDNKAVDPLLKAILKEENYHYNGTLVHALSYLDCREKLVELFEILFYHEYEPRMSVVNILEEQEFVFSDSDLKSIKSKWEYLKKHPEKCPEFDKAHNDIEYFVNGFICNLEEK